MISFWGRQDNPFAPPDTPGPRCPICGQACETIYKIRTCTGSDILGCDLCYDPGDFPDEDVFQDDPWEDHRCMEDS